jgi:hypothetical protein
MNFDVIIEILRLTAMLALGFAALYFKVSTDLRAKTATLITEAEQTYKDTARAGGEKFAWVVDNLYAFLPAPLRLIVGRAMVEQMVQGTFDALAAYAKTQLDRIFDREGMGDGISDAR